jgi:tyrosine aminotransferase
MIGAYKYLFDCHNRFAVQFMFRDVVTVGVLKTFFFIYINYRNDGAIEELKIGIKKLAQVILGASNLTQGVIPAVLKPSSDDDAKKIKEWKQNLCVTLEKHSDICFKHIGKCHGLSSIQSNGAMYLMVEIDIDKFDNSIQNDIDFTKLLLEEENVVTLPGAPFLGNSESSNSNYYFRIMFCAPPKVLDDAFLRIQNFCSRHAVA